MVEINNDKEIDQYHFQVQQLYQLQKEGPMERDDTTISLQHETAQCF